MSSLVRAPTPDLSEATLSAVRQLLDSAFVGEFSDEDWHHTLGGWHVLLTEGSTVLAHAAVITRRIEVADRPFHTGYVEGVATQPQRQGERLGSRVMAMATEMIRQEFDLGALATDRHRFYGRLGWERWQGPTYVRDGSRLIRTEDEDDAIMVLRFGASASVDLTSDISCESRAGDDW